MSNAHAMKHSFSMLHRSISTFSITKMHWYGPNYRDPALTARTAIVTGTAST